MHVKMAVVQKNSQLPYKSTRDTLQFGADSSFFQIWPKAQATKYQFLH